MKKLLDEFFYPYIAIRDLGRSRGYAVSIVKAGLRAIGRDPGPVRAPLCDLRPDEYKMLQDLIAKTAQA
jgi:5-dehydro-4-deoxyglucarate dehydratase